MPDYLLGTATTDFSNCTHRQYASCGFYIRKRDGKRIEKKRCSFCHANFVIGADSRSEKRCTAIRELMAGKPISGLSVSSKLGRRMAALLDGKRPACGCGKPPHPFGCAYRNAKAVATRQRRHDERLSRNMRAAWELMLNSSYRFPVGIP